MSFQNYLLLMQYTLFFILFFCMILWYLYPCIDVLDCNLPHMVTVKFFLLSVFVQGSLSICLSAVIPSKGLCLQLVGKYRRRLQQKRDGFISWRFASSTSHQMTNAAYPVLFTYQSIAATVLIHASHIYIIHTTPTAHHYNEPP